MKNPETCDQVTPIDPQREQQVRSLTRDYIARAGRIYDSEFPLIPVMFDLRGRAAGMYRVRNRDRVIRYNPYIFAKYFDDNLITTVPHEVAHYVVDLMYNGRSVRPHGAEWRRVMQSLGAVPNVTGTYDLSGVPLRRQKRHSYRCQCSTHQISTARHNRIVRGEARYYCRKCKSAIRQIPGA